MCEVFQPPRSAIRSYMLYHLIDPTLLYALKGAIVDLTTYTRREFNLKSFFTAKRPETHI